LASGLIQKGSEFGTMLEDCEQLLNVMKEKLEFLSELDSLYLDHRFEGGIRDLHTKLALAETERRELEVILENAIGGFSKAPEKRGASD
jgi:hypothetical protein